MKKKTEYKYAIPCITLMLVLGSCVFLRPLNSLDELWNYNFARNIYGGAKPYTDFNMVQTPLSAYVSSVFLHIFDNHLFSFRILGCLLISIMSSFFYKICLRVTSNQTLSFCVTLYIFSLQLPYYFYDYNYLNLMLVLIIMLLEIKEDSKYSDKKCCYKNLLLGLLYGLTPLIKQSTGLFMLLVNILISTLILKKDKNNKWMYIGRVLCSVVPGILFLLELILTESFQEFWDYGIKGIKYFDNHITYFEFMLDSPVNFLIGLLPVIILVYTVFKIYKKQCDLKYIKLFLLSAAEFTLVYPIADQNHVFMAVTPMVICALYDIKGKEMSVFQRNFCMIFSMSIMLAAFAITFSFKGIKLSGLKHYEWIPIQKDLEQQINDVDNYITKMCKNNYKVYIADASAAAYMIPLDIYNKDFDMLLIGNTGSKDMVQMVDEQDKSLFLILKDECELNWQSNEEVINYIREHYTYLEEVSCFYVYQSNRKK